MMDKKPLDFPSKGVEDKDMVSIGKEVLIDILKALDGAKKKLQEAVK